MQSCKFRGPGECHFRCVKHRVALWRCTTRRRFASRSPSPDYDREALIAALSNPAVSGATIYTTEVPQVKCNGGGAAVRADKGCIVKEVFRNFTK